MGDQTAIDEKIFVEKPTPWHLTAIFYILASLHAVNLTLAIIYQGSIPSYRLVLAKEVIMYSFTLVGKAATDKTIAGNKYIEEKLTNGHTLHRVSEAKTKYIIQRRNKRMKILNSVIRNTFIFMYFPICGIPYIKNMMKMIKAYLNGQVIPHLPVVVFHVYYPELLGRGFGVYVLAHTYVTVLYALTIYFWCMPFKCAILAGECFMADIRLLAQSMELEHHREEEEEEVEDHERYEDYTWLRYELSKIVENHQKLYRDMDQLKELFQRVAVGFINFYALQMCVIILFIVKAPNITQKLALSLRYVVALSIMYACSQLGESIREEGKKLRMSIWQCPWVDKPIWLRKTLTLMLTRATREMEFRPYGLYALDIKCVIRVLQGTYTYFNVLKKVGY